MTGASYGALAAKVRAIYGGRLLEGDLGHMEGLSSVEEVLEHLRQQGSWAPAAGRLAGVRPRRGLVEAALRQQLLDEFSRISHFVPSRDRLLLDFPVRQGERDWILTNLRRLRAARVRTPLPQPSRFLSQSPMDWQAMGACASYEELASAARRSIFYPALRRLRPGEGEAPPNYAIAEATLNGVYYSHIWKLIRGQYQGHVREQLLHAVGSQVDLSNIVHILRLKEYFPQETNYLPTLLPISYRLDARLLGALRGAPSAEAVFELLEGTPYARDLTGGGARGAEAAYRRVMAQINRRMLLDGTPSVCTAIGFLNLRAIELRALVRVIESVSYRAPREAEPAGSPLPDPS